MNTYLKATLTSATPVIFKVYDMFNGLSPTVWWKPLNGDGITVEYSLDGGDTYEPPLITNTLTSSTDRLLSGITHVRFTRASGTGTTSTVGVC